jgi:hypothetical protein
MFLMRMQDMVENHMARARLCRNKAKKQNDIMQGKSTPQPKQIA